MEKDLKTMYLHILCNRVIIGHNSTNSPRDFPDVLHQSFVWGYSTEGHPFWAGIKIYLMRGNIEQALKLYNSRVPPFQLKTGLVWKIR